MQKKKSTDWHLFTAAINGAAICHAYLNDHERSVPTAGCCFFVQTDIVTARTLAHLARVSSLRGKKEFAIQTYENILRIYEALPAPLSYDRAIALRELAVLRQENGSQEEAHSLRSRADGIIDELSSRAQQASANNGGREASDDTSYDSDEDDEDTASSSSERSSDKESSATA